MTTCDHCGKCVDACQTNALSLLGEEWGTLAGTPVIEPRRFPCWLSADMPCIPACPTGALVPIARTEVRLGLAVLDTGRCLPYHGVACDRCGSLCPVKGAILVVDGKPSVVDDVCTGCGVCEHVCPTDPASIRVKPARQIG